MQSLVDFLLLLFGTLVLRAHQLLGQIDYRFLCFLLHLRHLLPQMFLQIDCVLLGVDVDRPARHQALHIHFLHSRQRLFHNFAWLLANWHNVGFLLQELRDREVVGEGELDGFVWGVPSVGV